MISFPAMPERCSMLEILCGDDLKLYVLVNVRVVITEGHGQMLVSLMPKGDGLIGLNAYHLIKQPLLIATRW